MNQILSTENSYKPPKMGGDNLIDMKKIIIIFSVLIVVFAVIILIALSYGKIRKKSGTGAIAELNRPTIKVEPRDNKCGITVEYDEGLDKVSFWWNDSDEIEEKNLNGGVKCITSTDIPINDYNILHIRATGKDGSSSELDQEVTTANASDDDPNKPKINFGFIEGGDIKIAVTSDKGIEEVSYSWEDESEIIMEPDVRGQKLMEFTIEGRRGTNTIKVKAIDIEGNEQTKEQLTVGIHEPEFNIILNHGNMLSIDIDHDSGFKKVVITINGQQVIYDEENYVGYSKDTTHLDVDLEVPNGHLVVDVEVYTLESPDKAKTWHREADVQV